MGSLTLLMALPLVWPFVAKALWRHEISLPEMLVNLLVGCAVAGAGYYIGIYASGYDVEVLNGRLVAKTAERVACDHSYSCNCVQSCSGSGTNQSCSTVCSTCYDHAYDMDWLLKTEVGTIEVARVDRQGLVEPPRFTRAKPGDPVAQTQSYQNYIKAAPESLFNTAADAALVARYTAKLPEYPAHVYDYHYVNRVLVQGVPLPDLGQWQDELARILAKLGPAKQVNAVVVLTSEASPEYAQALRAHWLGGKKNDVVVVIGLPDYPRIGWVQVFSWSDQELFKVQLKDAIAHLGTLEREKLMLLLESHIQKGFVRKPMADFDYLKNEIELPLWALVILSLLSLGASITTSVFLSQNNHKPFA